MTNEHKGLDLILGKIQRAPSPTLVSRYLALVAELSEPDKSSRALDAAQLLVKSSPSEALQIAHMVYKSDHANVRALDVMIAALTEKGRFGKAEVLRIERAKVVKATAKADEQLSDLSLAAGGEGSAVFSEDGVGSSRIAELDLGSEELDAGHGGMLEALFPSDGSKASDPAAARSPKLSGLGSLAERPSDTVLPFRQGGAAAAQQDAPTIHLADQANLMTEPPLGHAKEDIFEGAPVLFMPPPEVPVSGFAAVIELFDYYWKQGFVTEARALLQQCAGAAAHEPWWQARHAQVEKSKLPFTPKLGDEGVETRVALSPAVPGFWDELRAEMKRVATEGKALMVPLGRVEKLTKLFQTRPDGSRLPEEFIRSLAEIDHRMAGLKPEEVLNLKWSLFQGLWGGEPDLACAEALIELDLVTATPAFFGLYLDALISGGTPRRALVEIQRVVTERPQLAWANVAWRRLPLVWSLLAVHGFNWSEDDGVQALLVGLKKRPRPKLSAVVSARR